MKKIGIFYGSTTGTTGEVARRIAKVLNVAEEDVHDVAATDPSAVGDYRMLVLGTGTWGDGGMDPSWYDFIAGVEELDLREYDVALFGCGDESMTQTFCSGVGELHDRMEKTGARFVAPYDTIGYRFEAARAKPEGALEAYALLLDEVNHPELTAPRIAGWATLVQQAAG